MSFDRYGPLWNLLDIPDEAIVHQMEVCLKRAGVYKLDDLAFLSTRDMNFPSMVKPIFVRKFRSICEFYALGHRLERDSTMQDVLHALNPRAQRPAPPAPPPPPPPPPPPQQKEIPVVHAVAVQEPVQEQEHRQKPRKPKSQRAPDVQRKAVPKQHLNVVIIGDCSPYASCWQHIEQFSKITNVRIHTIINTGYSEESLIVRCRKSNILLKNKIEELSVAQPNLYVLGSTRIHEIFKLMDMYYPPSCVLMDLPGTITAKSLQSLQTCSNDNGCPIYINIPRAVAPYVKQTLEVASTTEPVVGWFSKEDITMAHMGETFSKGRILHTTALPDLVIAVMYFGAKVESICRFRVNPGLCNQTTLNGITDYVRAAFQVTTESGVQLSIVADRNAPAACCLGVVSDEEGRVIQQFDHFHGNCELMLKRRLVRTLMEDSSEVIPSIRMGVEALRLAEYAEEHIKKAMTPPKPEKKGIMRMLSRRSVSS